jgi:hypothetical protein
VIRRSIQVLRGKLKQYRIITKVTKPPIAMIAQQPPDLTCFVVVVNY